MEKNKDMTKDTYPRCYAKFKTSSINEMTELLKRSIKLEHGASLCMDRNKLINLRNMCVGNKCFIIVDTGNTCEQGEIKLGDFHTHANEIPPFPLDIPSSDDWYGWIDNSLSCLGSKNNIKCYQKRRDYTSEDIHRMEDIVTNMEMAEYQVNQKFPDPQDPALKRYKKYNEELEEYYYRFNPEECNE